MLIINKNAFQWDASRPLQWPRLGVNTGGGGLPRWGLPRGEGGLPREEERSS